MTTFWYSIDFVLFLFVLLLLGRIVLELTRSFSRSWWPSGVVAVGVELVYTVTDPPVRLLRRLVPPLRVGGISLDLSVMIVLLLVYIARSIVQQLA